MTRIINNMLKSLYTVIWIDTYILMSKILKTKKKYIINLQIK